MATESSEKAASPASSPNSDQNDDEVVPLDGTSFSMYYGQLLHQQNMLQDVVRTGTYQTAFAQNAKDFHGATVLDVGTGSGVLAFFAIQSGAQKVYAVEMASRMAEMARMLVEGNKLSDSIEVIESSVEDLALTEKVDILVSEPIGFLLVHERMLESFITARDRFLRPGGKIMPTRGTMIMAPFSDESLWREQQTKADFWAQPAFYGIDLSAVRERAQKEFFGQAVVGNFSSCSLLSADRATHVMDFETISIDALQRFDVPLKFNINRTAILHGIACWFDLDFLGSTAHIVLTTSPDSPTTHWYQCRLLFREPIAVNAYQSVTGKLSFVSSSKVSYTIRMTLSLDGTPISSSNTIHLQDQMYHYLGQSNDWAGYGVEGSSA